MTATRVLHSTTSQRPPLSLTVYDQRQSIVSSSGGSFFTARASPSTASPDSPLTAPTRSSSVHTLTPPLTSETSECIDTKVSKQAIQSEEHCFVQVTRETVMLNSGPMSSVIHTTVKQVIQNDCMHPSFDTMIRTPDPIVPPLPSPPASIDGQEPPEIHVVEHTSSKPMSSLVSTHCYVGNRSPSIDTQRPIPHSPPALPDTLPDLTPISSTEMRLTASPRIDALGVNQRVVTVPSEGGLNASMFVPELSGKHKLQTIEEFLSPMQSTSALSRPTRRSTTGSHMRTVRSPLQSGPAFGDGDIKDDIQIQAEQIRRERKRKAEVEAVEAAEVEAVLTQTMTMRPGSFGGKEDDNQPLVGNLIGEDHVNYVLMYNMLTGIRTAVSRCQAKMKRPLTEADFTARHKYSFDIVGNELTPSAKYDFKFKDYAPWVFRELREDNFQLDPADYLLSLTAKYILSELGSPGKSGSFFYFSRDYRFIIKTIRHSEHKFLLSVLKQYHAHVKNNPDTLLSRFYGLHRVKLPRGRKIHFVIMNNLFPPHKDIHETYDLKGSTVGRIYPEEKAKKNPRAVLKDLNWINRRKTLGFGPEKRASLTEQIRRDSELLKKIRVMDYSLLVGIHHMQRGNRENVRRNTLKVVSPSVPNIRRRNTHVKGGRSPEAIAMRRAMRKYDLQRLGSEALDLCQGDMDDRFIFYKDEGGLQATDEFNCPTDTLYYLGIIDILTPYSKRKKVEHLWKGLSADRHKISPVPPAEYAERFIDFMKSIMHSSGDKTRLKAE